MDFAVSLDFGSNRIKVAFYKFPRGKNKEELTFGEILEASDWGQARHTSGKPPTWVPNLVFFQMGEETQYGWDAEAAFGDTSSTPEDDDDHDQKLIKHLKLFPSQEEQHARDIEELRSPGFIKPGNDDEIFINFFHAILKHLKSSLERYHGWTAESHVSFGMTVPYIWKESPGIRRRMKDCLAQAVFRAKLSGTETIRAPVSTEANGETLTQLRPEVPVFMMTEREAPIIAAIVANKDVRLEKV
jgi:hypothetical protein